RSHERQPNGRSAQQEQATDVGGKRGDLAGEVEPGPARIPLEQAAVPRHERRVVRPRRGDAEADAGERQKAGAENSGVTASGQAEVVVAWAAAREAGSEVAAEE